MSPVHHATSKIGQLISASRLRVCGIDFEETKISKIKVFSDTGDMLYFRVVNEEDNPDDHRVVPGEVGYEAIKELFLKRSIELYADVGESPSTAFCQRQRISIENDLKLLGYKVHGYWVAVREGSKTMDIETQN